MQDNIYSSLETEVDIFNDSGAFDEEEFIYEMELDQANTELRILAREQQEIYYV
jgi:hypothetical protein